MILNKNYVNAAIRAKILPDDEMRKIGFTDYNSKRWRFTKNLDIGSKTCELSFNVVINKENPLDLRIDILDDDFAQPYDYQLFLKRNSKHEVSLKIKNLVEGYMKYLQDSGVLSGHIEGEYI